MTEISTEQLKKLFHQDMIELYKKIIKIVKYKPTRLMDYINRYGGYEAAVKYINTESNLQDFAVLWEKEHLDLSVEALIVNESYRSLFDEEILSFCDRKLKEYSYAPNKIEEVEEPTGYVKEDEKMDIAELIREKEFCLSEIKKKEYPIYQKAVDISVEQWKNLLQDSKVVTANNLDLLLRIYEIGDEVGPNELAREEGYSNTYPYKEVATALGKRIKTATKIDIPTGEDGKPLWWHLLFNGGIKDNSSFEWSLKNNLRLAIRELIESGNIKSVTVVSHKEIHIIEEEKNIERIDNEETSTQGNENSAFERLFESIMGVDQQKHPIQGVTQDTKEEIEPEAKGEAEQEIKQETMKSVSVQNEKHLLQDKLSIVLPLDYKQRKKKECIDYYGAICDICGFDFGYTYGEDYEKLIEVHNVHQDMDDITEETHPINDLIPICCNCHHVIHSQTPAMSVEYIRSIIRG